MIKKKMKMNNNYFKLGFILIGVALITLIAANIYQNTLNNKINNGYLTEYVSSINYNEINNTKTEFSGDTFLYVSYSGDKEIYNLDIKLKKVISDNELREKFIYLDLKDHMKDSEYLKNLNNSLTDGSKQIYKLPAILYYKDDKLMEIIDSKESVLRSSLLDQLIDKYEITND